MAVDTKINFDDNAKFRQAELFKLEDLSQTDPREVEAAKYDLNCIPTFTACVNLLLYTLDWKVKLDAW
jgi:hypothetical protein